MTIDRSAQRAGQLSHALGTFVNNAYATYTRDEIIAALRLALDIETHLDKLCRCDECGGDTQHTTDCSHHWTQTVGAP